MARSTPFRSIDAADFETPSDPAGATAATGERQLAWLASRMAGAREDGYRYLLICHFALVNLFAFALLGAAYAQGYVDRILTADPTHFCVAIFLVFLVGLVMTGWKVVRTSQELNRMRDFDPLVPSRAQQYIAEIRGRSGDSRALAASALKLKLSTRIAGIRQLGNSLVLLGLIGTVTGFIIALSGVDPSRAGDVAAIGPMVSTLIEGMSVALYTTLVGAALNLWTMVNFQVLTAGTVSLITGIVDLGERYAGT